MKKLSEIKLEDLHVLYSIVSELCNDYSKMTDNYSLTTGDNTFEHIPEEFREMVKDRQKFISYKLKLKDALVNSVIKKMENYE